MKAASLWSGTDYAWYEYRGRGRPLPLNARRIKVLKTEKESDYRKKRDETFAIVMFLNDDGSPNGRVDGRVRARDIIDFWDQYEIDRKPLKEAADQKERERQERMEQRRIEREKEYAAIAVGEFIRGVQRSWERREELRRVREREERVTKHKIRITNVLVTKGVPREYIEIVGDTVFIKMNGIERWLGIEPITDA